MGGQSFIEYEAANDTIPPMAETKHQGNTYKLIFRDDREDDTGIYELSVIEKQGIDEKIPKYSSGVPQLEIETVTNLNTPGRIVFKAMDIAMNISYYTVCYQVNPKTGQFEFMLNEGIIKTCDMDEGWQIGGFFKNNFFYHHSDFTVSGGVNESVPIIPRELGKFMDATSSGLTFGGSATHRLWNRFYGTGKLAFEEFSGLLEAPDITISHYRNPDNGELLPFKEGRSISLQGYNLTADFQLEFYLSPQIYTFAGLSTYFNISNSIEYKSKILTPKFVEYSKAELELMSSRYPHELSSLNFINFGGNLGFGIYYPIVYNFSAFFEASYTKYFGSLIDDGNWNMSKFSLMLGIKYRI
jgi:hypothetical protein